MTVLISFSSLPTGYCLIWFCNLIPLRISIFCFHLTSSPYYKAISASSSSFHRLLFTLVPEWLLHRLSLSMQLRRSRGDEHQQEAHQKQQEQLVLWHSHYTLSTPFSTISTSRWLNQHPSFACSPWFCLLHTEALQVMYGLLSWRAIRPPHSTVTGDY